MPKNHAWNYNIEKNKSFSKKKKRPLDAVYKIIEAFWRKTKCLYSRAVYLPKQSCNMITFPQRLSSVMMH